MLFGVTDELKRSRVKMKLPTTRNLSLIFDEMSWPNLRTDLNKFKLEFFMIELIVLIFSQVFQLQNPAFTDLQRKFAGSFR